MLCTFWNVSVWVTEWRLIQQHHFASELVTHDETGRQILITWFIDLIASYILSADKNWELKGRCYEIEARLTVRDKQTPRPSDCYKHWNLQNWKRRHSGAKTELTKKKKKSFGTLHGVWIDFSQLEQPFSFCHSSEATPKSQKNQTEATSLGFTAGGLCLCQRCWNTLMSKSSSPAHSYHAPQGCILTVFLIFPQIVLLLARFITVFFFSNSHSFLLHRLRPDPQESGGCGVPGTWVGCSCGAGGCFGAWG